MNKKLLLSIFLVVFIDLLGFSLILPLLPYYAKSFNASDLQVGLLVASYAAAQLISAPILGRLSDQYGRRPLLLISVGGTFLSFILLAFSHSLTMLFVARILDGMTAGNLSIAQAYITDVTDEKSRGRGLGMIGAAFGLGFIIGPALGGALSTFGYAVPAFLAAGLSGFNLLLIGLWLPESLTPERREAIAHQAPRKTLSPRSLLQALRRPLVGPLLHTRFFFGLAFSLFQTIFALYSLYRFGLDSRQVGYVLSYVGLLSVLVQGVGIGKLTERFSDNTLIFFSTALMAISLLGWALSPSIVVLLIILAPLSFSGGVLNTVINSAISKSVPPYEIGGMLGISASLESLTRVLAPSLGGLLLEFSRNQFGAQVGTSVPGVFAALLMFWLVTYVWRHIYQGRQQTVKQAV